MQNDVIIDSSQKNSVFLFRDSMCEVISPIFNANRPIIFLCIGSDRSTGDSLGPLIGEKLNVLLKNKVNIYGTLEHPVHAKNLCDTIEYIHNTNSFPFIVAIDACLGSSENIGKIFIKNKPLSPGSAMNKDLPKVGDLSITGTVNISGTMEFMILQNTRLFTVMQMVNIISSGIYHSMLKIFTKQNHINSNTIEKDI